MPTTLFIAIRLLIFTLPLRRYRHFADVIYILRHIRLPLLESHAIIFFLSADVFR